MTSFLGEFLEPAGEHMGLATACPDPLSDGASAQTIQAMGRVITALGYHLRDMALPDGADQADTDNIPWPMIARTRLALRRSALALRQTHPVPPLPPREQHPAAAHLSAAADFLMTSRDLLQSRRTRGSYSEAAELAGRFYWASVAESSPVTSALLAEITGDARILAPWVVHLSQALPLDRDRLVLHDAARWLYAAGGSATWQRTRGMPGAGRRILHGIPVTLFPARQPPRDGEPIAVLCAGIIATAERPRHAAVAFAPQAAHSPAANSVSWRRHALGAAITNHTLRLILRGLLDRAIQLGAAPVFRDQLREATAAADEADNSYRAVSHVWDTLTTSPDRDVPMTPVAAEIEDLTLRAGRLAYREPRWTPGITRAARRRDPAALADQLDDIPAIVSAVHHAADAVHVITTADRQAVREAISGSGLLVPSWTLSAAEDPPFLYLPCPPARARGYLRIFDDAFRAGNSLVAALDEIAISESLPSAHLAAPRRNPLPSTGPVTHKVDADPAEFVMPEAGQIERLLHYARITEPALLTRAELADAETMAIITDAALTVRHRDIGPWKRRRGQPPKSAAQH
jgi:hypothetical protein